MIEENELQGLAERILALSTADETEVLLLGQVSRLTRFANSYIHQNVAEANLTARVRAAFGQKVGVASTNDLTPSGLQAASEQATALARLQTPDPYFTGLPQPDGSSLPTHLGYTPATAGFRPEERAQAVSTICNAAETAGLVASGAFNTGEDVLAVANSHGLWRYHRSTEARLNTVIMGASGSGWACAASTDVAQIDAEALAGESVGIARNAQDPIDFEPGEYPVVLGPDAVADMLSFFGMVSFNGLAVQEARSFLSSRLGQQVMSPSVSIWDDGLDETGLPRPFDFEGVPKQRVALIQDGIARGAVWDRRTAAKAGDGKQGTGHSLPAPNSFGPLPGNLFMAPGAADRAALLTGIERGIWITRFWYTRVVHPLEVVITGMTRDGTFLIENGRITRPVRNLRFTQSYLAALADVTGIGSETHLVEENWGAVRVPAIRVGRFNFTGITRE